MSAAGLTCPYCNAIQAPRAGLAVGARTTCPRCGESFVATSLPEPAAEPPATAPAAPRRVSNRALATAVLGVMVLMGGLGLAYALVTQDFRRQNDKSLPRKSRRPAADDPPAPDGPPSPASLDGLAYLPRTANVIAGAYLPALRADPRWPAVKRLRLGTGPATLSLEQILANSGLDEADIDHVVLGATLRALDAPELTPPITVVLRTARDYDSARLRKALKATRPVLTTSDDGARREVYRATLGKLPASLWQPDARTAVVGIFDVELKHAPGKPHEGAAALPAEVRQALEERLSGAPPLWAVGHSADWGKTVVGTLLAAARDVPLADRIGQVRTFALALSLGRPARLVWQVQAADEAAARDIEAKVLAPRAAAAPGAFKFARDGAWLTVQTDVDLGAGA